MYYTWEKHGNEATKEAFGVSRPTLYRWQKELKDGHGKLESLSKKSTAPKTKRRRVIQEAVKDLIRAERAFDSHLSKDKLAVLLKEDRVAAYSASTIGRMLADLKKKNLLPKETKLSYYAKKQTLGERKYRLHARNCAQKVMREDS